MILTMWGCFVATFSTFIYEAHSFDNIIACSLLMGIGAGLVLFARDFRPYKWYVVPIVGLIFIIVLLVMYVRVGVVQLLR